jgi:hypothetical protein
MGYVYYVVIKKDCFSCQNKKTFLFGYVSNTATGYIWFFFWFFDRYLT